MAKEVVAEVPVVEEKERRPKKEDKIKGLHALRAGGSGGGAKPSIKCDNCGCMRFNECGCTRSTKKAAKEGAAA